MKEKAGLSLAKKPSPTFFTYHFWLPFRSGDGNPPAKANFTQVNCRLHRRTRKAPTVNFSLKVDRIFRYHHAGNIVHFAN